MTGPEYFSLEASGRPTLVIGRSYFLLLPWGCIRATFFHMLFCMEPLWYHCYIINPIWYDVRLMSNHLYVPT